MKKICLTFLVLLFMTSVYSQLVIRTGVCATSSVVDIDGNVYGTIKVGSKWWMVENLRTTRLNDGTSIKFNVSTDTTEANIWGNFTIPAYCWVNDNQTTSISNKYGALYNYHAVRSLKLCPTGWFVPRQVDFDSLCKFTGNYTGLALKSKTGWQTNNGLDAIGFDAKPAGDRFGVYQNILICAEWWTSEQFPNPYSPPAYSYPYGFSNTYYIIDDLVWGEYVFKSNKNQSIGLPVRCICEAQ
jgi:uncharacterized protein (TIGR02145 family)